MRGVSLRGLILVGLLLGVSPAWAQVSSSPAIDTVMDEGTALGKERKINFIGSGVSCTRNTGLRRIDCTVTAGGSSAGAANALQGANGSGGFSDSGCTATGGLASCQNGFESTGTATGNITLKEGTAPGAGASAGLHNTYIDSGTGRLTTHKNGGSAKDYATASDTQTLTNKTIDCTTAGNVCTAYKYIEFPLVGVAGGTAGHIWNDDPLSTTCTATAGTGVNQTRPFCTFPDVDGEYGKQLKWNLPPGYVTGSLAFRVTWKSSGTGSVRHRLQVACYAHDAVADAAYSNSTYITAGNATAGRWQQTSWTTATDTGCDADEILTVRFSRNRTEASDTINAAVDVEEVDIRYAFTQ